MEHLKSLIYIIFFFFQLIILERDFTQIKKIIILLVMDYNTVSAHMYPNHPI